MANSLDKAADATEGNRRQALATATTSDGDQLETAGQAILKLLQLPRGQTSHGSVEPPPLVAQSDLPQHEVGSKAFAFS